MEALMVLPVHLEDDSSVHRVILAVSANVVHYLAAVVTHQAILAAGKL